MEKIIVTGATGFIGKALLYELIQNNYEVYAIVRNKDKAKEFEGLSNIKVIQCEMKDIHKLAILIRERDFKAFFHFSWDGTSGIAREDYNIQLENIRHTCKAVEVARVLQCEMFVYAGSLMEYECMSYIHTQYSKPVKNYIYRSAKLTAHQMSKSLAVSLQLDFRIGTISNAYGVGELSPRLINSTIRKLLNAEKTSFTSGIQQYDFIYITDVAKAFRMIAEEGKSYGNYYIGNRKTRELKDFLIDLKNCIDRNIELGLGEISFDSISTEYSNVDRAALYNDTSFECQVSFEDGIKKTIDWIRENE